MGGGTRGGSDLRIDAYFTPAELNAQELAGATVVAVDVLRATSSVLEALANGAKSVLPAATVEEASRLVRNLDRKHALLCGERASVRVDGFDLGNSPSEFTRDRVADKRLVMTTTNGTAALLAAAGHPTRVPKRTLVASFLNLSAVSGALEGDEGPLVILCAGREGRFALEDAVLAGALVDRLAGDAELPGELNDAAYVARALAREHLADLAELLPRTAAGARLIELGMGDDLTFCAQVDRHPLVPELRDGQVTL